MNVGTGTPIADSMGEMDDSEYHYFLQRVSQRFASYAKAGPVFCTTAENLWSIFLGALPSSQRQHYNCSTCRHFVERFGGLVSISAQGKQISAMWDADDVPRQFMPAVSAMCAAVQSSAVSGLFVAGESMLGQPTKGGWSHLHTANPVPYRHAISTPHQAMAEKREEFRIVARSLVEFSPAVMDIALQLLETDSVYRSEKVVGPAQWLRQLHAERDAAPTRAQRDNVTWLAVAKAPSGFCHPRSSMIGTLLEDIAAGKSYNEVAQAFAAKMHPLRYQRPQAAPTEGNIADAERLFARLGLAPALERRIARVEEIPKVWQPAATKPAALPGSGIFSHLKRKILASSSADISIPAIKMTVEKFVREVMPDAEFLELRLTPAAQPFIVLTTALHDSAPHIMQWDSTKLRNPFAWYIWHGGAKPARYGLKAGWTNVAAITKLPSQWNDSKASHQGEGLVLLLEGARESRNPGAAIFPEHTRSELRGVRSAIESFSRVASMQGLAEGSACGFDVRKNGGSYPVELRVRTASHVQLYSIDRWD